jgi:prevent-host-death family protein
MRNADYAWLAATNKPIRGECARKHAHRVYDSTAQGSIHGMRKAALSEVKDDLSKYLRLAEKEEVVITRHGRPAGVLIGFESEDDWFDYRLENDPRFLKRVEAARRSLRAGRGVSLEDVTGQV